MRSLQDEIRQAQRDLFCPICSRTFGLKDINVRSFLDSNTVELSVVCQRGHFPVVMLVPVTLRELARAGQITPRELKIVDKRIDALKENLTKIYETK